MRTLKATLLVLFFGTVLTLSAIAYTNVGRAMPADVVNGDFELGPTGWTESSINGMDVITDTFFAPHSGLWVAAMGDDPYAAIPLYEETASISQMVSIPVDRPYLTFWAWIISEDFCGWDLAYVKVNDGEVSELDLCEDEQTHGWRQFGADLTAYAGQSVSLAFQVITDDSYGSAIVLDDIAFADSLPAGPEPVAYLPIICRRWPPIPYTPVLDAIDNGDADDYYTLDWNVTELADTYQLQEDDNAAFSSPTTRYSGTSTYYTVSNQPVGTWYYRVRGCNSYGCGAYSNVRSTTVRPPETDVWVGNYTGCQLCLDVYNSGIGNRCWSSNGDFFYGSFAVGTYTYKVSACCGSLQYTEYLSEGYYHVGDYSCGRNPDSGTDPGFLTDGLPGPLPSE